MLCRHDSRGRAKYSLNSGQKYTIYSHKKIKIFVTFKVGKFKFFVLLCHEIFLTFKTILIEKKKRTSHRNNTFGNNFFILLLSSHTKPIQQITQLLTGLFLMGRLISTKKMLLLVRIFFLTNYLLERETISITKSVQYGGN